MKLRSRYSALLLLVLPSVATAIAAPPFDSPTRQREARGVAAAAPAPAPPANVDSSASSTKSRAKDTGSKIAPFDGKDGKPHEGPFVEIERKKASSSERGSDGGGSSDLVKERPQLKGRPQDPTVIDGVKIPDSNDGVMDDKARQRPKEGTTGTEGGVSQKDKERKAKEGVTGERVLTKPETPKEAPPMPHSEEEKIMNDKDAKTKDSAKKEAKGDIKSSDSVAGLEKPDHLPDKPHDKPHPVPESANKDHLDLAKSKKPSSSAGSLKYPTDNGEPDGFLASMHSFVLSLTMILFSEIGDKTFLIAALMAMKHDRAVVFSAAFGALLVMTVLSAMLGHAVPTLLPQRLTSFLASGLFFVFGGRLLREGLAMSGDEGVQEEMHEVERELAEKEKAQAGRRRASSAVSPYVLEMGLGGANGRRSRSKSRFPTPPRSPSTSPGRSPSPRAGGRAGIVATLQGLNNLLSLLISPVWVQTFVMTFLGEWGDRSQIATIAMAAGDDYWLVILGALLGHMVCTGVAVIGGRAIAGRVSMKIVTLGGAVAFLVFGVIYFVESFFV